MLIQTVHHTPKKRMQPHMMYSEYMYRNRSLGLLELRCFVCYKFIFINPIICRVIVQQSAGCQITLTHQGRATHICVSELIIIGRRQVIIWTKVGILLIWPLGINFSEIVIEINTFSFKKMHLKMASAKLRLFRLGLSVLNNSTTVVSICRHKLWQLCMHITITSLINEKQLTKLANMYIQYDVIRSTNVFYYYKLSSYDCLTINGVAMKDIIEIHVIKHIKIEKKHIDIYWKVLYHNMSILAIAAIYIYIYTYIYIWNEQLLQV